MCGNHLSAVKLHRYTPVRLVVVLVQQLSQKQSNLYNFPNVRKRGIGGIREERERKKEREEEGGEGRKEGRGGKRMPLAPTCVYAQSSVVASQSKVFSAPFDFHYRHTIIPTYS